MRYIFLSFILLSISSCYQNDAVEIINDDELVLSTFLENKIFIENEVIACAASEDGATGIINVYFYPETGAKDFKLY